MTAKAEIVDSDFRYFDGQGNLLRTRTELAVAQLLSFLGRDYEYGHELHLDGRSIRIDFKTERGLIEVIDGDDDIEKYRFVREHKDGPKIVAIGHPKHSARVGELDGLFFYDQKGPQTGSIFMEDQSFTFDYAHVLPLVEKCSLLHGHTSSVMVELVGQMKDNLLMDFGEAKKIIRRVMTAFDHKFFVNERYVKKESETHYEVSFDGPQGAFDLRVPKNTAYLLRGEATVENLSTEIIRLLEPELPENVEAVGVHIYEGYNKGSHAVSRISRA